MTQVDIMLRHLPESYDITVGHKHSYDIFLNNQKQSHDIYIYNLVNKQSIYGDELDPLIFRLTENEIECLLDVSLLETALLYQYDDRLLDNLGRFPISVLEHGGGYNYFSLTQNNLALKKTMYATLQKQIAHLSTNAEASLAESVGVKQSKLKLTTSGEITNTVTATTEEIPTRLVTQIRSSISKVCEIILNTCGLHWFDGYLYEYDDMLLSDMYMSLPKMSLVASEGKVYMKFSFDIRNNVAKLQNNIANFVTTVNLKDAIRSVMHLTADASFSYRIICSCKSVSTALNIEDISLGIQVYITPQAITENLSDEIRQDIHTQSALGITSQDKLTTSIADDLEAHHGFGYYDRQYLYYWDDYTLEDMGAEIINKTSSVSVDM